MPRLKQLLAGLDFIRVDGDEEREVTGIHFDSRRIRPGNIFVAVPGLKTDGHHYIPDAIKAGARVVVVEKPVQVPAGVTVVQVQDSRRALSHLGAAYYGYPSSHLRVVGVTGTNGKTTTTYLIESILRTEGYQVGLLGTIGGRVGQLNLPVEHTTPESLDLQELLSAMVKAEADYAVMEVSSHALALGRVLDCEFDVAVFTNLTQDHLDFHGRMEEYREAKLRLFASLGEKGVKNRSKYGVVNVDDPQGEVFASAARVPVIGYGIERPAAVQAREVKITPRGASFWAVLPLGEIPVNLQLTGRFNVYNALAAIAVGWQEGASLASIKRGLEKVRGVPGRFELVDEGQNFAVVVDYAHTPDGLENLLVTAREVGAGRLITVFGCGGDRDRSKRPLMGQVAGRWSDYVVVTSDNPRTEDPQRIINDILPGLTAAISEDSYTVIPERAEAIRFALKNAKEGDIVVIAGKGHETYQIIGQEFIPFDDREVARQALRQLGWGEK